MGVLDFHVLSVFCAFQCTQMGDSEEHEKSKQKPQAEKYNNPIRTVVSNLELGPINADKLSALVKALYRSSPRKFDPNPEAGLVSCANPGKDNDTSNVTLFPRMSLDSDVKNMDFYSEERLQMLLLKKLEAIYNEAYTMLISYGYQPDHVLKAILTNGHVFGSGDILTNIVQNSLSYLKTGFVVDSGNYVEGQQVFEDMETLVKNTLAVMIYLIIRTRQNLIKGDAMWCLLKGNFNLGVANSIAVPFETNEDESQRADNNSSVLESSGLCKFEGNKLSSDGQALDFSKNDSSGELDVLFDKKCSIVNNFKNTPSLKADLKMSIGNFAAACRAGFKMSPEQCQASKHSLSRKNSTDSFEWEDSCMANLVLGDNGKFNIHENKVCDPRNPKNKILSSLLSNIKEIKQQVKEREGWAQEKVIQAAKKLSHDMSELGRLRREREEKLKLKNGKVELDEETMKKIRELEDALKMTGCRSDLAKAAAQKLEVKNAEFRAEVEAFKLRASESDKMSVEVVRREKKCLKKIQALEKQNKKYLEEIEEEKNQSFQLHQKLDNLKKAQEEIEVSYLLLL